MVYIVENLLEYKVLVYGNVYMCSFLNMDLLQLYMVYMCYIHGMKTAIMTTGLGYHVACNFNSYFKLPEDILSLGDKEMVV